MTPPVATPRIRGRGAELAALDQALGRVSDGHAAIAVLEGEAGIGKTSVLAQAQQRAYALGFDVVLGRADELERSRPFGVLADAFACRPDASAPRRAAIGKLLAGHSAPAGSVTVSSDPGLQFQAVDAFVDLVESLALDTPLVVLIDDLQWADPSSLLTLGMLARRLAGLPVALVATARPLPRIEELDLVLATFDAAGADRLALGPLRDDAVTDLVAETVGAEPGPCLLDQAAGAAGNPLFVTELVGALLKEGAIEIAAGRAEVSELTLPPTLRLTILRRLSFLPDDTLASLRSAAVLGVSFGLSELAEVTARPALELVPDLAYAIQAGVLVEEDDERLRFRHDLIREAIYDDLPASLRVGLHREQGQRLARAGAPARQVAGHLLRGATTGDAEAIAWLRQAARETAPTSPAVAADLLGEAVSLTEDSDPSIEALSIERAEALMWAGRISESAVVCDRLLDRGPNLAIKVRVRLCRGRGLIAQGRPAEALEQLQRAQAFAQLTEEQRADVLGWSSVARISLHDLDGAADDAERVRAAASEANGQPAAGLGVGLHSLAIVRELQGRPSEALQIIDDAVQLADRSENLAGHRVPLFAPRGHILIVLDAIDEAIPTLEAGRRRSEQLGVRWALPNYEVFLGLAHFLVGDWDDAVAELEAGLDLADEIGEHYSIAYANCLLSLIALHRGELQRASLYTTAADRHVEGSGPLQTCWAAWSRALVQDRSGSSDAAYQTLSDAWRRCAETGLLLGSRVVGADLVRLSLLAGDRSLAAEVTAAAGDLAACNDVPSLTGAALRCQGLLDDDPDVLVAAVEAYEKGPRLLELALAAEDAGVALARAGNADAVLLLERASSGFEVCGADDDSARVDARLRDLGVKRGRRGQRSRATTGWESLTPTELRVANLVAEGMSNPQIGERLYVSRRTVQTHVGHAFAKLQISSRAQLAAEVIRHRDDDGDAAQVR